MNGDTRNIPTYSCNLAQLLKKELEKLIKIKTNQQDLDILALDCGTLLIEVIRSKRY